VGLKKLGNIVSYFGTKPLQTLHFSCPHFFCSSEFSALRRFTVSHLAGDGGAIEVFCGYEKKFTPPMIFGKIKLRQKFPKILFVKILCFPPLANLILRKSG